MERHLNLIKNEELELEKRVFPRFPFSYLTFKADQADLTFQVVDISFTGAQLCLKDGGHQYIPGQNCRGQVHWKGRALSVDAQVKWINGSRIGLAFNTNSTFEKEIRNFLSVDHFVKSMRPLHKLSLDMDLPTNLKYWLQADGPIELFVWRHQDGETARFQMILLDQFVEWEDGHGLKTGKVLTKRDMDTPLFTEDEFLFQLDAQVDQAKLSFAQDVIQRLGPQHLPDEALEFLNFKLGN